MAWFCKKGRIRDYVHDWLAEFTNLLVELLLEGR